MAVQGYNPYDITKIWYVPAVMVSNQRLNRVWTLLQRRPCIPVLPDYQVMTHLFTFGWQHVNLWTLEIFLLSWTETMSES